MSDRSRTPRYHTAPLSPEQVAFQRPNLAASRARVIAKNTENDEARRALLAQTGQKDTGQSRTDLGSAAGADLGPSKTFVNAFGNGPDGTPAGNKSPAWTARFHNIGQSPADAPQLQTQSSTGSGTVTRTMAAQGVGRPAAIEPGKTVSGPGVDALMNWGANKDADAARAAAGSGNVVQTGFGSVSSRAPAAGEKETALVGDQSTGPKHLTPDQQWQADVVAKHPEIGVAGTKANADFVQAYKAAHAGQGPNPDGTNAGNAPVDHLALADKVMGDLRTAQAQMGPPTPRPSQLLPPAQPAAPPSAVAKAGETTGAALEGLSDIPGFYQRAANGVIDKATGLVTDFRDAVNGGPPSLPGTTPDEFAAMAARRKAAKAAATATTTPSGTGAAPSPGVPAPTGSPPLSDANGSAGFNGIGADDEEEQRKRLTAAAGGADSGPSYGDFS